MDFEHCLYLLSDGLHLEPTFLKTRIVQDKICLWVTWVPHSTELQYIIYVSDIPNCLLLGYETKLVQLAVLPPLSPAVANGT